MGLPDKKRVLDAVLERMQESWAQMIGAAQRTREGATHAEAKPENEKDTRALEQSYLARGQAARAEEITEQIHVLRFMPLRAYGEDDPIGAGALIALEGEDDSQRCLFLAPHGGGTEVQVDGVDVLVVTPVSSMGRAVLGRSLGDEVELRLRNKQRSYTIAAVR
jgi:transcription elongation GreA/GreB family factor